MPAAASSRGIPGRGNTAGWSIVSARRLGRARVELRAPPAVPAAVKGSYGSDGERRVRAAGRTRIAPAADTAPGPATASALRLGLYARHWLSLAARSRVGARSEDDVRRALAPLQADGWR